MRNLTKFKPNPRHDASCPYIGKGDFVGAVRELPRGYSYSGQQT